MKNNQTYKKKTKAYYNSRFGENIELELNGEEELRWEVISECLDKISNLRGNSDPEILDFGCGNGRFSFLLRQYGKVTGIDFADKAIEKAANYFPEVSFIQGDASNEEIVSKFDQQFDIIVSTEVVEHIQDQQQYFKNIQRLLKPEGYLILTTPNQKWFDQYFEYGQRKSTQPYEFWLPSKELNDTFLNLGFEVLKLNTFRSEWIFEFKTFGFLRIPGNRLVRKIVQTLGWKELFVQIANRMDLGINLVLFARKKGA